MPVEAKWSAGTLCALCQSLFIYYRSARETNGDDAVGFVQVQRLGNVCTVKAKITPEHRIKSKAYCCTFTCDETEETVLNVQCHDCAAQKGGCKHSVAL